MQSFPTADYLLRAPSNPFTNLLTHSSSHDVEIAHVPTQVSWFSYRL